MVSWYYISKYQKLSENFIEEFKNRVRWDKIFVYQNLTKKIRIKYEYNIQQNFFSKH